MKQLLAATLFNPNAPLKKRKGLPERALPPALCSFEKITYNGRTWRLRIEGIVGESDWIEKPIMHHY